MNMRIEDATCDDAFVSGHARLMPFLTAIGRKHLSNVLTENLTDMSCVKRLHTDGILTSAPLKGAFPIKKEAKLGELGVERISSHCVVSSMRKPVFAEDEKEKK
jgi:hypothetical protein